MKLFRTKYRRGLGFGLHLTAVWYFGYAWYTDMVGGYTLQLYIVPPFAIELQFNKLKFWFERRGWL